MCKIFKFFVFVLSVSDAFIWSSSRPHTLGVRPYSTSIEEKWLKVDNGGDIFYANIETGETSLNPPLQESSENVVPILVSNDESEVEISLAMITKLLDSILIPSIDRLNVS